MLDPKLQNNQNITNWNWFSFLVKFLDFTEQQYLLIVSVRHLKTVHSSPQYHVVFDDFIETVYSTG